MNTPVSRTAANSNCSKSSPPPLLENMLSQFTVIPGNKRNRKVRAAKKQFAQEFRKNRSSPELQQCLLSWKPQRRVRLPTSDIPSANLNCFKPIEPVSKHMPELISPVAIPAQPHSQVQATQRTPCLPSLHDFMHSIGYDPLDEPRKPQTPFVFPPAAPSSSSASLPISSPCSPFPITSVTSSLLPPKHFSPQSSPDLPAGWSTPAPLSS